MSYSNLCYFAEQPSLITAVFLSIFLWTASTMTFDWVTGPVTGEIHLNLKYPAKYKVLSDKKWESLYEITSSVKENIKKINVHK